MQLYKKRNKTVHFSEEIPRFTRNDSSQYARESVFGLKPENAPSSNDECHSERSEESVKNSSIKMS